jgi:hypothetical protein
MEVSDLRYLACVGGCQELLAGSGSSGLERVDREPSDRPPGFNSALNRSAARASPSGTGALDAVFADIPALILPQQL